MSRIIPILAMLATLGFSAQAAPALRPHDAPRHALTIRVVHLNTATSRELRSLPGVGELLAQRIIAARPLRKVEDLKTLRGVQAEDYRRIRPLVTL